MANNIISDWLETYALYSDTPEQEAATRYAAQLDRLVEAARAIQEDAREHDTLHPNHVTVGRTLIEHLEAALRDIELESEVNQ